MHWRKFYSLVTEGLVVKVGGRATRIFWHILSLFMCCTSNLIIMYFVFFSKKKSFPLFGIHFLKLDTFWSIPSNISKKSLIIIILIIVFLFSWIYHYFWCFFALIIISLLIAFFNMKFSLIWDDYCISVHNFSMDLLQFFFFFLIQSHFVRGFTSN